MIFKILCCLVLIVCWVYGLALLAWMIIKLDVKKRREKMNVQNIEEVQQMRWIPVEERLPEEGKRCLLYTPCDRILCVGYYAGKDERQHRHKWRLVTAMRSTQTLTKKVTHWMPLPQPPKHGHIWSCYESEKRRKHHG